MLNSITMASGYVHLKKLNINLHVLTTDLFDYILLPSWNRKRRYDNVRHYFDIFGIQERSHRNQNRLPHNGFNTEELKTVVTFLRNYSEQNAILLPGRIPGYKRTDLQLLPTHTTRMEVSNSYIKACATLTFRVAAYKTFCKIWRKYTPHILITTPRTDLCWTCQQNSFAITSSSNKTDVEKERVHCVTYAFL